MTGNPKADNCQLFPPLLGQSPTTQWNQAIAEVELARRRCFYASGNSSLLQVGENVDAPGPYATFYQSVRPTYPSGRGGRSAIDYLSICPSDAQLGNGKGRLYLADGCYGRSQLFRTNCRLCRRWPGFYVVEWRHRRSSQASA